MLESLVVAWSALWSAVAADDTFAKSSSGSTIVANLGRAFNTALAYVQRVRGLCLGGFANWRMLIVATL